MATMTLRGKAISGRLTASTHGTTTISYEGQQPQPPVETTSFVRMVDDYLDGASWYYHNYILQILWETPGGDWTDANDVYQGGNQFGNIVTSTSGTAHATVRSENIAALINKHLTTGNTGIY